MDRNNNVRVFCPGLYHNLKLHESFCISLLLSLQVLVIVLFFLLIIVQQINCLEHITSIIHIEAQKISLLYAPVWHFLNEPFQVLTLVSLFGVFHCNSLHTEKIVLIVLNVDR